MHVIFNGLCLRPYIPVAQTHRRYIIGGNGVQPSARARVKFILVIVYRMAASYRCIAMIHSRTVLQR